jgi:parvulin-like peptidyl-prolyl isomerase
MLKRLGSAFVLSAAVVAGLPLEAQVIEQVLVQVNGDIVTLSEFEERQLAELRTRPELARMSPSSPQFVQAVAESAPRLILSAVDELLWMQRAKEHGWSLTPERLTEIIAGIRKQNNLEDEAVFRKALQAEGLTEEKLRRDVERNMLIQQAQQVEVFEKITISDEEVRAYYEANRAQFTTPSQITLREILIAVPTSDRGVNVAQSEEARATAEEVRRRLLAGEPFPRLVAEVSAAANKNSGGLIGPIRVEEVNAVLQEAFAPLKVGDITEVLQTTRGFQIFKLEARTESTVQPLEDVRAEISRRVADRKSQGEMIKYLERLRAQAKITWRHQELKKAYEIAVSQRLVQAGIPSESAPPKS